MPMSWTEKEDVRLFMNVLSIHQVKLDHAALAVAMGPECTAKAIVHRIAKLRAIAAGTAPSSSPSTPRKPRTPKASTGKKRSAAKMDEPRDDDAVSNNGDTKPKREDGDVDEALMEHKRVKLDEDTDNEPREVIPVD